MKSGRYIGVMSGTSLDGVDVVLAAIDEHMVAQQASYCHPIPRICVSRCWRFVRGNH